MVESFTLPDTDEFDHSMNLVLTRKQTNEIKTNPKQYKFLSKTSPFDYLDLHNRKFYTLNFRVVRFAISEDSYECIITNLPLKEFPAEEIKKIYSMRWGIEICDWVKLFSFKKGGVYHAGNLCTPNSDSHMPVFPAE